MPGESISQIPIQATGINGATDLLMISQYTGIPGAEYVTRKATATQVASAFINKIPATAQYFIIGGGGPVQAGPASGGPLVINFAATITAAEIIGDVSGSASVDIWRCSYAQYDGGITHPVAADSICGGNYLTISSGVKGQSNLTSWNTSINSGDFLAFYVNSSSSLNTLTIIMSLARSVT
jgi:hypothetical protein